MRDGKLDGMQDFDTVIRDMIDRKVITMEDGLSFATNQNNLMLALKGLAASDDFIQAGASPAAKASSGSGSMLNMIE